MTQRYAHLAKSHLLSEMQMFGSIMPIQRLGYKPMDTYMDTKAATLPVNLC